MSPTLGLRGLVKAVGGPLRRRSVLKGVTCSIPSGRVVGLLGRNGAGKTTLLRLLLGHARPDGGHVDWGRPGPPRRIWLPEGRALPELGSAASWAGAFEPASAARRRRLVDQLDVGGLWSRPARRLSSGERRRVELVLTLSARADVYLLDEPTTGLDPLHLEGARAALRELAAEGATVLVSTHLVLEHEDLVDPVVVLHRGRVVAQAGASELREGCVALRPERPVEAVLDDPSWVTTSDGRCLCRGTARRRLQDFLLGQGIGWSEEPCTLRDAFLERVGAR